MPAERLECDGEPTFSPERRQVGDGLFVRCPQRPPESGLAFSGGQVPGTETGVCGVPRDSEREKPENETDGLSNQRVIPVQIGRGECYA